MHSDASIGHRPAGSKGNRPGDDQAPGLEELAELAGLEVFQVRDHVQADMPGDDCVKFIDHQMILS
jgi:hypothetical protein